ncbi:hypothetical protein [Nodosilinea nodulosa]|uniref:hypothetical protein n=1 Tax=Nodosilinea nodulosa TaxID=416001 RepID=UPI0003172D28|nr:hypothetical protein [Nodosilinea nodulosa]
MSTRNTDRRDRDFESSISARPVTKDEIAYRDGYVRGKSAEQLEYERRRAAEARIYEENARLRADNGLSIGLILGLILAAVAAVVGGLIYVYSDADTPGAVAPTPETTSPEPASNNKTTVIERTIERTREAVPVPSSVQPPDINVEVPSTPEQPSSPAPTPSAQPDAAANQAPTDIAPNSNSAGTAPSSN